MTSKRRSIEIGSCVILAIALGTTVLALFPSAKAPRSVALGALSGRGLEPPWWTAVSFREAGSITTYTVPADVLFPFDSAEIDAAGQAVLRAIVPQLLGAKSVLVAGCTDSVGGVDSPYNVALSKSRAEAAVAVLEASGAPGSLFQVQGWADTRPANTARGLDSATIAALDRRVVIEVTK